MKKQDKKQKVIAAAAKVLAEKGYEKASIKDIAKEAGITSGLIHYYFQSKEEILSYVLLEASKQYTRDMETLKQTVSAEHMPHAAMSKPKDRVQDQPDWYKLRYELFAIGLRNPHLAEGVNAILENGRKGITNVLTPIFPASEDVDAVAAILLACFDGLALQKLLNPEFDIEKAYATLERVAYALKDTP